MSSIVVVFSMAAVMAGTAGGTTDPNRSARIVFSDESGTNGEIFVMNPQGQGAANVTRDPAEDGVPDWSPDGSKIAFVSDRGGGFDIYSMESSGKNVTRLTETGAESFPDWSPDGSRIAFASVRDGDYEIYVMNADGSGETRLTFDPATTNTDPAWSPDGTRIAFTGSDAQTGQSAIWVMAADGSNPQQLIGDGAGGPAWSPNGQKLAFWVTGSQYFSIATSNADGTGRTVLVEEGALPFRPSWSSDGSQIAFTGALAGIFVIRTDGTGLSQVRSTGYQPDWRPGS